RELRRQVPVRMNLTEEQLSVTVSTGQSMVANRIGWAASYLTRVDALERPKRGHYRIAHIGRQLLAEHPERVTETHLRERAKAGDRWWVTAPKHDEDLTSLEPVDEVD